MMYNHLYLNLIYKVIQLVFHNINKAVGCNTYLGY